MITFDIDFTEGYLLEANARFKKQFYRRWVWIILNLLLVVIFSFLMIGYISEGDIASAIPPLVFLLVIVFLRKITSFFTVHRFRKSPYHNEKVKLEFNEAGFKSYTPKANTEATWAIYTKARRFKDGFLLFQGPRIFSWLPDRCMTSGSVEEFEKLITTNVKDYEKVG